VFTRSEKVGAAVLAAIGGAIVIISWTGDHPSGATARAEQVHSSGPPASTIGAGGGLGQQVVQEAAQMKNPDQQQTQEPPDQGPPDQQQSSQPGSSGQQNSGQQAGNGSNGGIQLPVVGPPGLGLP
jgi:hypothetical protein